MQWPLFQLMWEFSGATQVADRHGTVNAASSRCRFGDVMNFEAGKSWASCRREVGAMRDCLQITCDRRASDLG
jgi:hypothetical protein